KLISKILTIAETPLCHHLMLAGACLADARRVKKDISLREEVIEKIKELYLNTPFTFLDFQAKAVLVRIGTPEVAQKFSAMLNSPQINVSMKRDAIEILSRIGSETEICETMLDVLQDVSMPTAVRVAAFRGLSTGKYHNEDLRKVLIDCMSYGNAT